MAKTLILDYSKWRCGGRGRKNRLGRGETRLGNKEGFQCCLGQFSLQLNKSLTSKDIKDKATPALLGKVISPLTVLINDKVTVNTTLSSNAMSINDSQKMTIEQKITALRELFGSKDYKIRVINRPK